MKKMYIIISTFLLATQVLHAQDQENVNPHESYLGKGNFVIKGKVENKPEKMDHWELAVTGYLTNELHTIPIKVDGTFQESIPIEDVQDIYLYLGDAITIFSYPGDTIEAFFDQEFPKETLVLKGKNVDREKELALCMEIFRNCRQDFLEINNSKWDREMSDSALFDKVNSYYDKKIDIIKDFEKDNGNFTFLPKFRDGTYFEALSIVTKKIGQLSKVHCEYPSGQFYRIINDKTDTVTILPYQILSYSTTFRTNESYRSFLDSYISDSRINFQYEHVEGKRSFEPVKDNYYFALSCLKVDAIRDWYITNRLNSAFTYYDFDEVASVYNEFKKVCENKEYLDVIEKRYQRALLLRSGNPAPDFELKDDKGKMVKLSDLKGKFVYIDFWGVGCGPCIHEFKEYKDKLYERYKDYDIAYVYICVDSNEEGWKSAIAKYGLTGINLIAEGWAKNPVCQLYNVQGIPHYVLIDKEGKIVNNKCGRPSDILMSGEHSEFDKLMKDGI